MSILVENLKIYNPLEHRSDKALFLKNIFMIFLVFLFSFRALYELKLEDAILNDQYPFPPVIYLFVAMFFMGITVGGIRMDIITKPFSYCLPDAHNTHRRAIFLIGCMIILLFSFASFLFSEKSLLFFTASLIIFSVATLPAYFIAIILLFYSQNKKANKFISLLIIAVLILLVESVITDENMKLPLVQYLSVCIFPLLLSSIISMIALWKLLDNKDLKNNFFGKNYSSSVGIKKIINSSDDALVRILPDIDEQDEQAERYLLNKVRNMPLNSMIRHFLSVLYSIEERSVTTPIKSSVTSVTSILFLYLLTLLTGFFPVTNHPMSHYPAFFNVFLSCFVFAMIFRPSEHNIFLPVGRSKQYFTGLIFWIIKPAAIIIFFVMAILSSYTVKNIAPELVIPGHILSYAPLTWFLLGWIAVIIPIIDIFIMFQDPPCGILAIASLILLIFILGMFFIFSEECNIKITLMTVMIIISNVFYLFILTRYWFRRDHV